MKALKVVLVVVLATVASCSASLGVWDMWETSSEYSRWEGSQLARQLLPTAVMTGTLALAAAWLFGFRRALGGLAVLGVAGAVAFGMASARLRSRPMSAGTLGEVRTVMDAQAAYKTKIGWYAAEMRCLSAPSACNPDYPPQAPSFLDPELTSSTKRYGYHRQFASAPAVDITHAPPAAADAYAYLAIPVSEGKTSSYCGDASGTVVSSPHDAPPPRIENGRCIGGTPLR